MGGSAPSPPTIIMPPQVAAERYQSLIPQESFQDVAETMNRIERETGKIQQQRYDEVGTPAEIGARQSGVRMREAMNYAASLPNRDPDTSFQSTPRRGRRFPARRRGTRFAGDRDVNISRRKVTETKPKSNLEIVRGLAKKQVLDAEKEYKNAVSYAESKDRPTATITENPSFANRPDETFLPTQLGERV